MFGTNETPHTELCRLPSILCRTRPIIRPRHSLMCPQVDHRLNGKAHPWLTLSYLLVLRVMRNIRCAMEQLVDTMPDIHLHNTAIPLFRDPLDSVAEISQ